MHSSVYSERISRKVVSYYLALFVFCLLLVMSFIQEVQGKGKGKNKSDKLSSKTLANFENDEYGNRRPGLGNIGCLFSKSVCDDLVEWCFDDYAFGRCLPREGVVDEPSLYRYDLSKSDTHALEKEIERLFALGYRWRHSYTQCVLQNMLESQRRGSEWEQAVCSEEVDQDLEGALKAFADEIDPWNVAFVKFTPSKIDPHANFADEMYRPPGILPDPGVEIPENLIGHETNKEAKSNSLSRLRQPLLQLTPPEEKLLEDAIEDYLTEDIPINSIPSWKSKKSASPLLLRASGSGHMKRTTADWEKEVEQEAADEAMLDQQVGGKQPINTFGVGPGGIVDEGILEPRIFSSSYNTPDMFRRGVELKDELVGRNGLGDGDVEGDESMKSRTDDNDQKQGQEELLMLEQLALLAKDQEQQQELLTGGRDTGPELQLGFPLRQSLRSDLRDSPAVEEERRELEIPEFLPVPAAALGSLSASADPHYTEGGLVFLRNDEPEFLFDGDDLGRSGGQPTNSQKKGFLKRIFLGADDDSEEPPLRDEYQSPGAFELGYGYGYGGGDGSFNGPQRAFERRERLDVKKPGPYYRTVNNFAFDNNRDKTDKGNIEVSLKENILHNPEFNEGEGPADMMTLPEKQLKDSQLQSQLPSQSLSKDVSQSSSNDNDEAKRQGSEVDNQEHQKFRQTKDANGANGEISGFMDKKSGPPVNFQNTISDPTDEHLLNIDTTYVAVSFDTPLSPNEARNLVNNLADQLDIRRSSFGDVRISADNIITFKVGRNEKHWNASEVAAKIENLSEDAKKYKRGKILKTDVGIETNHNVPSVSLYQDPVDKNLFIATFALCGIVAAILVAALSLFLIRKHAKSKQKIARLADEDPSFEACKDYQDLCRARMAGSKNNEKVEPLKGATQRVASTMSRDSENGTNSSRSSTSSWTEEPVLTNMDISTGHMVLSYMEDHLKKRDRLDQEWAALCNYEADPCSTSIAEKPENSMKNRYSNSLPYDHSRVILNDLANINGSDYINASTITDHDPRNPAYIATQGPLATTAADFWQMVWEQGSVVIVTLTRLADNGTALCHRYWPEEGSELHHIYEVHLVSEHIWCDEYLVRSFYLKNLKTGETRTVTQFHFQAWLENSIPQSTKAILEFRRKVNKSYRGRSCPIIVHCSDGAGRTGTYCLIDMVLNRMAKGAKEIDIAASLEHIRDQRPGMVRTKQQFEFVLMAVAEEVHAILKALPQ